MSENFTYGKWATDDAGLPCFDLGPAASEQPGAPFRHLIGTGLLSALLDRWGNVNFFTTDGGFLWLNSPDSALARGSMYAMLEIDGELISLLHSELSHPGAIRYGTGYAVYEGIQRHKSVHLGLKFEVFVAPDRKAAAHGRLTLTNLGDGALEALMQIRADVAPCECWSPAGRTEHRPAFSARPGRAVFTGIHPQIGDIFLQSDESWQAGGQRATRALERALSLAAGETSVVNCSLGFGPEPATPCSPAEARQEWARQLIPYQVEAPEAWMREECLWNAGQLLSFLSYDRTVDEFYVNLGGYGWPSFGVREVGETSMVLAESDWELAAASLRWVAKTQLANGDIPKGHNMRYDRPPPEFDSDTELWFVLGCGEGILSSGRMDFLDDVCTFWDGGEGTIWEHLRRAFYWVRDGIGRGRHGLVLIREGDWNDYLSLMGAEGHGESAMNSGMACRAFSTIAKFARQRGDDAFADELELYVRELREAMRAAFDGGWFVRGYTDSGKPVGSVAEDRVFINAQSWAALGGCGSPEQRREALENAVRKCHTDIGLTLMSRPFSSPAPGDISWCAIPAGEGENAGIWPQTIYWMVWALAEEGLLDLARQEWICGTLRNHARHFPRVPFGIFNGPDCFSSHWAKEREGWTQVQLIDRARFVPMNPMVAWQGFAMRKILRGRR